jgi:hypothetical protein
MEITQAAIEPVLMAQTTVPRPTTTKAMPLINRARFPRESMLQVRGIQSIVRKACGGEKDIGYN